MNFSDFEKYSKNGLLGTPSYVFNIDMLKDRIGFLRRMLPDYEIIYAMKANPFLISSVKEEVDSFEICSPGEERICEKAGIPAGKMVLSGVNKEAEDFARIFTWMKDHEQEGKPICTVESMNHMAMLEEEVSKAYGEDGTMDVLLRVTAGNQFGLDEEDVVNLVRERASYPHLAIRGLQLYSGTQKKLRSMEKEIAAVDALISRLEAECGFAAEIFEYGPGLPVSYFKKETPVDEEALLAGMKAALSAMRFKGQITLEMGRFLAASCGFYVTRVMDKKVNRGVRYLIMDGGIHQVNYYGQMMAMKLPYMLSKDGEVPLPSGSENEELWSVCGSLCTVSDVIVKEVPLHEPETGDILVFENVGAYSVTEGISLFLSRDLPRVYLLEKGVLREVRTKINTEEFNYG